MKDAAKIADGLTTQIFSVECTLGQFRQFSRAALEAGQTLEEWSVSALELEAREYFRRKSNREIPPATAADQFPGIGKMIQPKPHLAAAAGPAIEAEVVETAEALIRVRICGLSMDPLLPDGSVIAMHSRAVSRSPYMKKGLIYLVRIDGGYTVKRFATRKPLPDEIGEEWAANGRVGLLESINPDFPPLTIKGDAEWLAWIEPNEITK